MILICKIRVPLEITQSIGATTCHLRVIYSCSLLCIEKRAGMNWLDDCCVCCSWWECRVIASCQAIKNKVKGQSHNWCPLGWKWEIPCSMDRKQAGSQEETLCNTKQEGLLSTTVWRQELINPWLTRLGFSMWQRWCNLCLCVCRNREKDLRCVPSGRACENLCLSCWETTQTCLTVSHSTSTDSEGLASIVFLQTDTNIWCQKSGFQLWEKQWGGDKVHRKGKKDRYL